MKQERNIFLNMKINELLQKAIIELEKNNIEESSLKTKILLSNCISKPKEYLFIHENEEVEQPLEKEFLQKIERLCNNEPLQYITNKQEFMGLEFYVDENVLIPRSDTEILVEEVLKNIDKTKKLKILDMCTGSGIIAITLAKFCENVEITAVDKSEGALNVAIKNAKLNNVYDRIKFIKSDMFENVNNNSKELDDLSPSSNLSNNLSNNKILQQKYDIIVSNPPYIESSTIKTLNKDVQKEPQMALDGGEDGLDFYRIIAENAEHFLKENGKIYLEIGYNQRESVSKLFVNKFKDVKCIKDLAGLDRVIIV